MQSLLADSLSKPCAADGRRRDPLDGDNTKNQATSAIREKISPSLWHINHYIARCRGGNNFSVQRHTLRGTA